MPKRIPWATLIAISFAIGLALNSGSRTSCASDPGPRAAVEQYLRAMKEQRFGDAYGVVTAKMTDGKPREEWAALQAKMFELGGVKLGEIDVRPAVRSQGQDGSCAPEAKVPNVLRAADVLNNQGSTEFETYTVVLEGKTWKVDAQETLFDEKDIRQYFPNDPIPAFKDTVPAGK